MLLHERGKEREKKMGSRIQKRKWEVVKIFRFNRDQVKRN